MNHESLDVLLNSLRLNGMKAQAESLAITAEREGLTFLRYLHLLAEFEHQHRRERRTMRLRKNSALPAGKTLSTLNHEALPTTVRHQIAKLRAGDFVDKAHNVLAFGQPGRGKTHILAAIGHALVDNGIPVLFVPTFKLVQRLLAAKTELRLDKELRKLDRFEAVILDDIGYVQQNREEMEVLFTFLAERYERKSVLISSNLVFSQWERIFKDPMTTAAAIDRLVHHAIILELTGPSYRTEAAKKNRNAAEVPEPSTISKETNNGHKDVPTSDGDSTEVINTRNRGTAKPPNPQGGRTQR
jgi:DNA replication protein DnaC